MKPHIRGLIRQQLAIVQPEEWTMDECLLVLGALTKITEGRSAVPTEVGGNVVALRRGFAAKGRIKA